MTQEITMTTGRAIVLWWSYTWRAAIVGIALWLVANFIWVHGIQPNLPQYDTLPKEKEAIISILMSFAFIVWWALYNMLIWLSVMAHLFTRGFGRYRLALVENDAL
ncbi:MAG TPA: hypothetical protein DDX54_00465 [Rhodospirillaceae bacterium]|nr:hypothetical protein [Alphaproteobacteria bacterium]HBH25866.1 hypothetical protein [Rhodospirillaceae bacterium]